MKIRVMSDLHNEFKVNVVTHMDDDKDTVLVLAGDICLASSPKTYVEFMIDLSNRFADIILIAGNHEHYRGNFKTTHCKLRENLVKCKNVHVLEKDVLVLGDVAFVCATLWTDFDNENPVRMFDSKSRMSDYRVIRNGPDVEPWKCKLSPDDILIDHKLSSQFIFDSIDRYKADGKKVMVVTHHAPSYQSIADEFRGNTLNCCYVSDLDELILKSEPDYWVHGHMHTSFSYDIGITKVICNPGGYYPDGLNVDFDPDFMIEL